MRTFVRQALRPSDTLCRICARGFHSRFTRESLGVSQIIPFRQAITWTILDYKSEAYA